MTQIDVLDVDDFVHPMRQHVSDIALKQRVSLSAAQSPVLSLQERTVQREIRS
ncbi:hypothetical protein [Burkholderia diffusa]|uniref:hypothetical protein n=1 Tax=Burkholderia diffusa TaxID=488732 RepID=UPI0018C8CC33|nr:hypothetical protein [Burkholderia diffusa]